MSPWGSAYPPPQLTQCGGEGPWGGCTCMGRDGETAGPHSCAAGPVGSLAATWPLIRPWPFKDSRAL